MQDLRKSNLYWTNIKIKGKHGRQGLLPAGTSSAASIFPSPFEQGWSLTFKNWATIKINKNKTRLRFIHTLKYVKYYWISFFLKSGFLNFSIWILKFSTQNFRDYTNRNVKIKFLFWILHSLSMIPLVQWNGRKFHYCLDRQLWTHEFFIINTQTKNPRWW